MSSVVIKQCTQRLTPNSRLFFASLKFIRAHAEQFDKEHFLKKMESFVAEKLNEYRETASTLVSAGVRNGW